MSEHIPLFRAARLVGVSRSTLQKSIREGGLEAFEGTISVPDLAKLYPKADLSHDSEYERVQNIKAHAYSKRVRERVMPDPEILVSRVGEFAQELGVTRAQLVKYQSIVKQITNRLKTIEQSADQLVTSNEVIDDTRNDIQKLIRDINSSVLDIDNVNDFTKDLLAHDTVLRIMAAHVKIQPSNHEYWLEGNISLLEAGVRSGLALNYGCTNGNCGLCKARLVSGEVKKIHNHDYVLSSAEKNMNYMLMCSNTAVTDVIIEALEAKDEHDIPQQEIITKIKKVEKLNDSILELHLQTPRVQRLRFLAGQSVTLTLPDNQAMDLPVASCPCDDRNLLFHIHPLHDDETMEGISDKLSKGSEVMVVGPYGNFLLNENSDHTKIFIAYDTGFAPVKSLIEHAMALDETSPLYLYRIAEKKEDLYLHNLCRSWSDALDDFHYFPVINNDPLPALTTNHHDLNDCDIYISGEEKNTTFIKDKLLDAGVPEEQIIIN
jgi:CDP-4-dehydro-6-deoxyglucose reductase